MTAPREWAFGTHRATFEPPDLVVAWFHGTCRLEDAQRAIDIYREVGSQQPFFLIVDTTYATLDKEARDYLTQNVRPEWLLGVVYVGAGLVQRAVTKALAIALSATGKWTIDFLFARTLEEARTLYARKAAERGAKVA
jgi:hypothetical protein